MDGPATKFRKRKGVTSSVDENLGKSVMSNRVSKYPPTVAFYNFLNLTVGRGNLALTF